MIYQDITSIPFSNVRAIIINVHTKLCTTLALLSTIRYAKVPVLLIDCKYNEYTDDFEYFEKLQDSFSFDLLSLPLKHHGHTLDFIFRNINANKVFLVDSDAELLDSKIVDKYLKMSDLTGGGKRLVADLYMVRVS